MTQRRLRTCRPNWFDVKASLCRWGLAEPLEDQHWHLQYQYIVFHCYQHVIGTLKFQGQEPTTRHRKKCYRTTSQRRQADWQTRTSILPDRWETRERIWGGNSVYLLLSLAPIGWSEDGNVAGHQSDDGHCSSLPANNKVTATFIRASLFKFMHLC